MKPRQLLRMAKWAKNPPGEKRVKLVIGVIVICLVLAGFEYLFGFPDWLVPERMRPGKLGQ
ncbi:hypothetical protein [Aliiroseovarius sp.]|uniref:hypothetical protein n=1 Tax=Aliiroseovarius sp. TaxID=1872442 RepID=UPI003BAD0E66